jgi:hypothetical protein
LGNGHFFIVRLLQPTEPRLKYRNTAVSSFFPNADAALCAKGHLVVAES